MRKLGYILLIVGFIWVFIFTVGSGPYARGMIHWHRETASAQQSYSREDVETAYREAMIRAAFHAEAGFIGALMMLGGGIILARSARRVLV
jgi:hypothetical protein